MHSFGRCVRIARTIRGMEQRELAKLAGVRPSYVSMLERGTRGNPSLDTMRAIADALRVPLGVLMGLDRAADDLMGGTDG